VASKLSTLPRLSQLGDGYIFCLDALSAGLHFCTRYWFRASSLDRLDLYQVYLKMGLKISLYSGEDICDTPFHATNYFLLQPSFFNMVLII